MKGGGDQSDDVVRSIRLHYVSTLTKEAITCQINECACNVFDLSVYRGAESGMKVGSDFTAPIVKSAVVYVIVHLHMRRQF